MPDDYRWQEMQRRMARVEALTEQVPVMARDIAGIKEDMGEVKEETKSIRRALYTSALSIVGAVIIFAITANEFLR